ncbi:hypothetical protein QL285_081409 [Trifolium repens]|nr:hypothetical protein QL285_081409 [Trifolium repens]
MSIYHTLFCFICTHLTAVRRRWSFFAELNDGLIRELAELNDINGNDVSQSQYSGKVLLIVNVASQW